ncbi:MAG: YdcF family protein, partial [Clostridiales Family XIII bacterium]|nr:YdcF family protein [Clostridiales Family XIII bacterium]
MRMRIQMEQIKVKRRKILFFFLLAALRTELPALLRRMPGVIKAVLVAVLILLGLSFLLAEALILSHMNETPVSGADYVIILGARVKGEIPSEALRRRTETAIAYLNENPGTRVVVTGGQGAGEDVAEAEAEARMLRDAGIGAGRIFMENRSTSTAENLEYAVE